MNCEHDHGKNGQAFFERFYPKVLKERIPLAGGLELTSRCNLNCVHCYVGNSERKAKGHQAELSTGQWIDLIDQMTDAGCLYLLFTGGETLLRPDFYDIYSHACRSGLLATVFTNGTLVTDRTLEAFSQYPPHSVEISLYGATAATYEAVTGVAGSFEKCLNGIRRLKGQGVRLRLKTMLLTLNFDELEDIEALAAGLGAPFRFDAMISPRLDGDQAPVKYRVAARDAVAKEFASSDRARQLQDFFYRMNRCGPSKDLYQCGAGRNMFHINPCGLMRPCLMTSCGGFDVLKGGFSAVWNSSDFRHFMNKEKPHDKCRECDKKVVCGYCPGFFKLESGSECVASDYLCQLGQERKQAILNFQAEVN